MFDDTLLKPLRLNAINIIMDDENEDQAFKFYHKVLLDVLEISREAKWAEWAAARGMKPEQYVYSIYTALAVISGMILAANTQDEIVLKQTIPNINKTFLDAFFDYTAILRPQSIKIDFSDLMEMLNPDKKVN